MNARRENKSKDNIVDFVIHYFSKPKLSDHELKAENHLKKDEIDLAITTYEQIRPVSASILVQIGQIYSDKKADYGNALNYYRRALKIQEEVSDNKI